MSIKKDFNRQTVLVAQVEIGFADLIGTSGLDQEAIGVPAGSIVVGGDIVVTEAFNSGTSDVLSVGDSVTYNQYASAANIHAAGRTALTLVGTGNSTNDINVRWVGVGSAPTAGKARLSVHYITPGRGTESYG